MPLLYLLLERHLSLFKVCQSRVLHPEELWDAADTIVWVFDAVRLRYGELKGQGPFDPLLPPMILTSLIVLFSQQRMDVSQQFKSYANELVSISRFTALRACHTDLDTSLTTGTTAPSSGL